MHFDCQSILLHVVTNLAKLFLSKFIKSDLIKIRQFLDLLLGMFFTM